MKSNLSSHDDRNFAHDPYALDTALMAYSTEAECAPIPPPAIGILFPPGSFECDFNAMVAKDINRGGTRENTFVSREYTFDG